MKLGVLFWGACLAVLGVNLWQLVEIGRVSDWGGHYGNNFLKPSHKPQTPHSRDPKFHMPLAGMDGFDGPLEDACFRMRAFFSDAIFVLGAQGVTSPVDYHLILVAIQDGHCSVQSTALQKPFQDLTKAWYKAGMDPLAPLRTQP